MNKTESADKPTPRGDKNNSIDNENIRVDNNIINPEDYVDEDVCFSLLTCGDTISDIVFTISVWDELQYNNLFRMILVISIIIGILSVYTYFHRNKNSKTKRDYYVYTQIEDFMQIYIVICLNTNTYESNINLLFSCIMLIVKFYKDVYDCGLDELTEKEIQDNYFPSNEEELQNIRVNAKAKFRKEFKESIRTLEFYTIPMYGVCFVILVLFVIVFFSFIICYLFLDSPRWKTTAPRCCFCFPPISTSLCYFNNTLMYESADEL